FTFSVILVTLVGQGLTRGDLRGQPQASRVLEQGQRRFDPIIRHEQLHTRHSAFHAGTYSDDGRGYSRGLQREPRQIGFDRSRIGLDGFHRRLLRVWRGNTAIVDVCPYPPYTGNPPASPNRTSKSA